jgi:hypothetical protein
MLDIPIWRSSFTFTILKLLLDHRVVDIRPNLKLFQVLFHTPEAGPLHICASSFFIRQRSKSCNPVSFSCNLLQFLLSVCLQNFSGFLKALVRELLKRNIERILQRGSPSSRANWRYTRPQKSFLKSRAGHKCRIGSFVKRLLLDVCRNFIA